MCGLHDAGDDKACCLWRRHCLGVCVFVVSVSERYDEAYVYVGRGGGCLWSSERLRDRDREVGEVRVLVLRRRIVLSRACKAPKR